MTSIEIRERAVELASILPNVTEKNVLTVAKKIEDYIAGDLATITKEIIISPFLYQTTCYCHCAKPKIKPTEDVEM